MELKSYDYKILELVQDPEILTIAVTKIAGKLKMSPATLLRRLKRLKEEGYFRLAVHVAPEKVGKPVTALLYLKFYSPRFGGYESIDEVFEYVRRMPEVQELYVPGGRWDLLAKLRMESVADFDAFVKDKIRSLPVDDSESEIILRTLKEGSFVKPVVPETLRRKKEKEDLFEEKKPAPEVPLGKELTSL
jgi:DNA-binding Lrp family transcriptional regulator